MPNSNITTVTVTNPTPAAKARDHALFRAHPLAGEVRLSTGLAPTPYHVYDGHGVFIAGTADLDAARALLAREQVRPVRTTDGRALAGVWVFDFADASLDAHHELQLSLFVSRESIEPFPAHRWALLQAMLTRPEVQMLCHGLWNSTEKVVAYNRERLALDARVSSSRIEIAPRGDQLTFSVSDRARGTPVAEGRLHRAHRPSLRASLGLLARVGLRPLIAAARQPWLRVPVLNPVGPRLARNAAAESFTKAETSIVRCFDRTRDELRILQEPYNTLDFQPNFFQTMTGFKFVYLDPR